MKQQYIPTIIATIIATIILTATILIAVRTSPYHTPNNNNKTDTITITKTHTVIKPIPKDTIITKYIKIKIPTKNTPQDTTSTPQTQDTAQISLPITTKTYRDTNYTAYISGYHANLDSIKIHQIQQQIIRTQTITPRFSIGIQAGAALNQGKIQPYIGIGISYNLINF